MIGLGLDCASARRTDDARDDDRSPVVAAPPPAAPAVEAQPSLDPSAPPPIAPPGTRYVSMDREACAAELATRGIPHEALAPRLGITSPVRLRGRLGGITFRTLWPDPERLRTSFEIMDCRLVLALDDFAQVLARHGVVDVMFFSAYRPPPAGWTDHGSAAGRHEAGLAIDIGYFRKADGSALNVERDFLPRRDRGERERICAGGPPARDATPDALELRKIACEARDAQLFHLALTPAYDDVHRDHFHFELTPDKADFVAR